MIDKTDKNTVINQGLNQKEARESFRQLDKFKQAARELEADEDEARWEVRLKKVAKQKPIKPADS